MLISVHLNLSDDLLYKDIVAGTVTTNGDFAKTIKAVKDKYTKE